MGLLRVKMFKYSYMYIVTFPLLNVIIGMGLAGYVQSLFDIYFMNGAQNIGRSPLYGPVEMFLP